MSQTEQRAHQVFLQTGEETLVDLNAVYGDTDLSKICYVCKFLAYIHILKNESGLI
jgi:hypothetical protein